jgi:hypothetical protein
MPVSRDESHQSAARFVGTLLTCKTHCLKKKYYRRIVEIIARTFDFGKNSKTLTFEALITRRPFANQNL